MRHPSTSLSNALILTALLGSAVLAARLPTAAVHAETASPMDAYQQFTAVVNAGDVAGMQALLTDDVVFVGGATCFPLACLGKAAVAQELAGEIAGHVLVTHTSLHADGNLITSRTEIREDALRALGIERIVEGSVVLMREGHVAALVTALDTSDAQTQQFLAIVNPPPST